LVADGFEVFHFGLDFCFTVIKLNAAVINLNIREILMSHCGRDKNHGMYTLNW
jgi:hypothetical protein